MPRKSKSNKQANTPNKSNVASLPKKKIARKKRNKNYDGRYHPRQSKGRKNNNPEGLLNLRTDTKKTFIDDNHEEKEIKVAFMFEVSGFKTPEKNRLSLELSKEMAENFNIRPVESIVRYSEKYSPLSIKTPGGSVLHRNENFGILSGFTNTIKSPYNMNIIKELPKDTLFFETPIYKNAHPTNSDIKEKVITITKALIEDTNRLIKKNGGKRAISQQKVINTSATLYTEAARIFNSKEPEELSHLIPHKISAEQSEDNLVIEHKHVNTRILFLEFMINLILKKYPEVEWRSTRELIRKTQIAHTAHIEISTKDFNLPFTLNSQQTTKPTLLFYKAIKMLFVALLRLTEEDDLNLNGSNIKKANMNAQPVANNNLFIKRKTKDLINPNVKRPLFKK